MERWEQVKTIATSVSVILIPIVLAFIGNEYSKSQKEREIQGKFVELSVGILKDTPSDKNKNLRQWATRILDQYSGVKLTDLAREELINQIPILLSRDLPELRKSITPIAQDFVKQIQVNLETIVRLRAQKKISPDEARVLMEHNRILMHEFNRLMSVSVAQTVNMRLQTLDQDTPSTHRPDSAPQRAR